MRRTLATVVSSCQQGAGIVEQGGAAVGELHAARQAVEQRHAQFALQQADLLRQRRLLDADALGRLGQVAPLQPRR
jgi:hypothetical protein